MNNIKIISKLVSNDQVFKCRGYSDVKVSRIDDGERFSEIIRVPIRTAGVIEYQENIAANAPSPPIVQKTIKAGTPEGDDLGISEDTVKMIFDHTDAEYVAAYQKHITDFVWKVAVFAMDIEWKNADDTDAKTFEEKKDILQSCGITGPQLDKIYADVIALSKFHEQRIDFLSDGQSDMTNGLRSDLKDEV